MYQYVQTLSYIASIFILILICVERYCAIIHPITCKQILTPFKLRVCVYFLDQFTIRLTGRQTDGSQALLCGAHLIVSHRASASFAQVRAPNNNKQTKDVHTLASGADLSLPRAGLVHFKHCVCVRQ